MRSARSRRTSPRWPPSIPAWPEDLHLGYYHDTGRFAVDTNPDGLRPVLERVAARR
ncbi:MAG TPA: hypothetical protein VD903_14535 [Pseudonocardia sp.]|nr:hypothetical protein [Pseudonocardia sp.]